MNPAHPPPTNNQRLTRKYSPSSWTTHQCRSSVCSVLPGFASFLHTTPFSSKTCCASSSGSSSIHISCQINLLNFSPAS
ncbi:hypothetical protein AMECASPLE_033690 [Ameca splendens]|uniref:Uncharacterized protein n=1 Tax=Ameca splendens TaxID=208324 RepID=A0ABV0Y757_9TELE